MTTLPPLPPTTSQPPTPVSSNPGSSHGPAVFRVLHTADLQLGKRQYASDLRARDFENTCRKILDAAVHHRVDAVVLAGDIFDMPRPPSSSTVALAEGVRACAAAGIPVLGVEGNHDVTDGSEWLRTCGVIPLGHATHSLRSNTSDAYLTFAGMDFVSPRHFLDELRAFLAADSANPKNVLVIHQMLAELTGFSGTPITAAEVADIVAPYGIRTVLMGDVHAYAEISVGGVRFCQPGSPEMTSANDTWPRSINILGFDRAGNCVESRPHIIDVRPVREYSIRTEEDLLALAELVRAEASLPMQPTRYVRYAPTLPDVRRRLSTLFDATTPVELAPVQLGGERSDMDIGDVGETFDRRGAGAALIDLLSQPPFNMEPNDPLRELIVVLMDRPAETDRILEDLCKRAGITLNPLRK